MWPQISPKLLRRLAVVRINLEVNSLMVLFRQPCDLSHGGKEFIWGIPLLSTAKVRFQFQKRLRNFYRLIEKGRRRKVGATAGTLVRVIPKQCCQLLRLRLSATRLLNRHLKTSALKNCKKLLPILNPTNAF